MIDYGKRSARIGSTMIGSIFIKLMACYLTEIATWFNYMR